MLGPGPRVRVPGSLSLRLSLSLTPPTPRLHPAPRCPPLARKCFRGELPGHRAIRTQRRRAWGLSSPQPGLPPPRPPSPRRLPRSSPFSQAHRRPGVMAPQPRDAGGGGQGFGGSFSGAQLGSFCCSYSCPYHTQPWGRGLAEPSFTNEELRPGELKSRWPRSPDPQTDRILFSSFIHYHLSTNRPELRTPRRLGQTQTVSPALQCWG